MLLSALVQHREEIKHVMKIEYDEAHKSQRAQSLGGILAANPPTNFKKSAVFTGLKHMYEKYEGHVFWCESINNQLPMSAEVGLRV